MTIPISLIMLDLKDFSTSVANNMYLIKIVESFAILLIFFFIKYVVTKLVNKSALNYEYQLARVNVFKKMIRFILILIVAIILMAIWGVKQADITLFISSILTVLGIAFFAQWSILSNITASVIIFFNHPITIGDDLTIMDKDYQIDCKIYDIGIFFITIKTTNKELVTVPSSVLMQKMIKRNTPG